MGPSTERHSCMRTSNLHAHPPCNLAASSRAQKGLLHLVENVVRVERELLLVREVAERFDVHAQQQHVLVHVVGSVPLPPPQYCPSVPGPPRVLGRDW
eukprot:2796710-Rhodomonas_salina.1